MSCEHIRKRASQGHAGLGFKKRISNSSIFEMSSLMLPNKPPRIAFSQKRWNHHSADHVLIKDELLQSALPAAVFLGITLFDDQSANEVPDPSRRQNE